MSKWVEDKKRGLPLEKRSCEPKETEAVSLGFFEHDALAGVHRHAPHTLKQGIEYSLWEA